MPEQKIISARSAKTIGYCFGHISNHIFSNKTRILKGGNYLKQFSVDVGVNGLVSYYPGYQRFFLVLFGRRHERRKNCDEELCCLRPKAEYASGETTGHLEDSKPETAHEKPLAPRVLVNKSTFFFSG